MTGASENFDPRVARSLCDWSGTAKLLCCRVDPLGRFVVAGGIDHAIQRWELATGNRTTLAGHDNWVRTLSFAADGGTLHSGACDGRWIAWEIAAEAPQPRHSVQAHTGWLRSLAVSHDGLRVVTCGNDRLVKVWSTGDGGLISTLAGHPHIPYCVQFVPGTYEVVSGDIVGNLFHWIDESGVPARKFDVSEIYSHVGDLAPFGGIINLSFSPCGKKVTVCGLHKVSNAPAGNRRAVAVSFDWATGEKLLKQECLRKDLDATMWRAVYQEKGTLIGVLDREIGFWNPAEADVSHLLETPSPIFDCDLHPNQIDLYTAHFDGHVRGHRLA